MSSYKKIQQFNTLTAPAEMCNAVKFKTLQHPPIQTKKCDGILQAAEAKAAEEARRAAQKAQPVQNINQSFYKSIGGGLMDPTINLNKKLLFNYK
jgi:hypothetical protein